MIVAVEAAS